MTATTQSSPWTVKAIVITTGLLLVQFTAAYFIGSGHLLTNGGGMPMPPIAIMAVIPDYPIRSAFGHELLISVD